MCRNIRVLHHFEPPTTPEEIRAAALQYVRKISGQRAPSRSDVVAFERAIDEVTEVTERLLGSLSQRGAARNRDREREKGRARFAARAERERKLASK